VPAHQVAHHVRVGLNAQVFLDRQELGQLPVAKGEIDPDL